MKIILGSNSPRRVELLTQMGFAFEQKVADIDEKIDITLPWDQLPEAIAQRKMLALKNEIAKDELLICADTLVFLDNRVLSKPRDREEARSMLESLSGRDNTVITGVCLYHRDQTITFSERTVITFATLTPENIEQYLDTEVCYDRAGAYGIQDWIGLIGVREIRGSYTNVMGLPTHRLYQEIRKF
ncbi:MAG: septum formation protein Maf [Flavobacteriia bacterium]|nr:septum formation protein Maf [Flavobacteriia bacterium]